MAANDSQLDAILLELLEALSDAHSMDDVNVAAGIALNELSASKAQVAQR